MKDFEEGELGYERDRSHTAWPVAKLGPLLIEISELIYWFWK